MIDFRNPYTPGAGAMPKYLAGREDVLERAGMQLDALREGYKVRPVAFYGLRGVGKTVLLNSVEQLADDKEILYRHIEIEGKKGLVKPLSSACNAFALSLSTKEMLKDKISKLKSVVSSFSALWNAEDNTVSFGLDEHRLESALACSGDLSSDLTEVFVALGRSAIEAKSSICFFLDELQYAKKDELEALVSALHRVSQLGLPITVFCAGLPKLLKSLGEAKTYSERLFEFVEIDSLPSDKAVDAIVKPAADLDVSFDAAAVDAILAFSEGYPYFIQELCSSIWEEGSDRSVDASLVEHCIELTNEKLDKGFFSVRYNRCTAAQKEFLIAMVRCGELPCTIANVAMIMGRSVQSISPFRAQLIDKGLVYATGRGEIDFTVPHFDQFLERATAE